MANADYLLIVTARPTQGNVLAWATECQSDQFSRPLCGMANIAPAPLQVATSQLQAQIGVVTHELGHALGPRRGLGEVPPPSADCRRRRRRLSARNGAVGEHSPID